MKTLLRGCFVIAACLVLTGCLDTEKIHISFDIDRDLQGSLALEFLGIHSSKDGAPEQKEEMRQWYESGYLDDVARIEQEWSLQKSSTEFTNKTDLKCDGKLTGRFSSLLRTLEPLTNENEAVYDIRKDKNRFSFSVSNVDFAKDESVVLTIVYAGKILEHNADKYDAQAHRMEWNFGKGHKSDIHFVLQTDSVSP